MLRYAIFGLLSLGAIAKPKNVLFLSVDDLRPEMNCISHRGFDVPSNMHTPNICALAKDSLVLQRAQVGMATCSPSRTTMLTGRRPGTTRVWDLRSYFRDVTGNFTTIPQFFKEHGYHSVGMGKIFHPGLASGGFDCPLCTGSDDAKWSWSEPYFSGHDPIGSEKSWMAVSKKVTDATPLQDTQVMERAKTILARVGKMDKPFFVAVGFHKPHLPMVSPAQFFDYYKTVELARNPYAPVNMPSVAWQTYGETRSFPDIARLNLTGEINASFPDWLARDLRRAYYSAVSYTDYNIGEVLKALEATGKANETVVSFWGDHGYQLGEHGLWDKHTNFDIATHVPMMFKSPGLTDGGVKSAQLTETIDMFPTLVELAMGAEHIPGECPPDSTKVQTCVEGKSLVSLINQPSKSVKDAALSVYSRGWNGAAEKYEELIRSTIGLKEDDPATEFPFSSCLTGGPQKREGCTMGYSMLSYEDGHEYRYNEWVHFPGPSADFKPKWAQKVASELYNHSSDPDENYNIAPDLASDTLLKRLSERLHNLADPTMQREIVV